ncbi:uncharacterized protein LOC127592655 [Hippocampus zosterae]|uniref:uncharacterized protein LOC127592655 n=1 Tax=Hippocampus zosterae TaxID=109293 RepID=UPI00223E2E1B|nr:uncharacterized protein LOC127592655 [Hippocampus zosterae]
MDSIVHGSTSLETETKCFHLSPKRAKRDDTSTCDLPDFLTLQTLGATPLASSRDSDRTRLEQNGHILDKKPCAQIQNTRVSVGPQAEGTISNAPEIGVICEERPFLHLKIYDQIDKLSPSPLSGSCNLKDATVDMSTHPQHQLLDKSLEDKPTDCTLPCENESSNDGEVRDQSYFSSHSNRHDTVPRTCSQSVAFDESNQKEEGFTDTIFQQGVRRDEGEKSPSLIKKFQLFVPPPDNGIPIMLEQDKSKVEMCDSHAVCGRETNDQANDNGTSNTVSPVECTEVLLISYHAPQAMYISAETESIDNFGRANGEHDEMAAEKQRERVHHTPETHMSAGISIEPAEEEDNNADLRRVMEPALWSKTVKAAEENSFNSESVAGEELPPSVPAGFDNFHKVRLSTDDDDDDAVQGNGCPHASLALRLMKSPVKCHVEDFANGDFNTDTNCTQGLSGEDMIASEFSTDAGNKRPPTNDPIQCLEFKMKNEFDLIRMKATASKYVFEIQRLVV